LNIAAFEDVYILFHFNIILPAFQPSYPEIIGVIFTQILNTISQSIRCHIPVDQS